MRIALAGNPNSGKTTMYNALTGKNEHVGNWAGVTVDKRENLIKKSFYSGPEELVAVDLPGAYSMSPFTAEESVTSEYVKNENPDVIINIVDSTNLSRSLFFTTQLLELGIPVVVALNKSDVTNRKETKIDTKALSEKLGCPVVVTSSVLSGDNGLTKVVQEALALKGTEQKAPYSQGNIDFTSKEAVIAADRARFVFTNKIVREVESRKVLTKDINVQDKVDRVITNPILGILIFAVVMFWVFDISQSTFGPFLADILTGWIERFQNWVAGLVVNTSPIVQALLVDGIIGGVGAVIGFLPLIMILFFLIALLEDSGYMARVAFILDKLFRKFGLSGRAFMPMIMGFGCSVPAMINTRTLADENEKLATIRVIPFFSCGAKLPILTAIAGGILEVFKVGSADLITYGMYVVGMVTAIVAVLVMRSTTIKGETPPFIMELPNYHMPQFKSTMIHLWDKAKHFIQKAFTIILASTIVIWFLSHFSWDYKLLADEEMDKSILGSIGMLLQPLFTPLGFGSQLKSFGWVFVVAAITGLIAKENVVATFGALAACITGVMVDVEASGGDIQAAVTMISGTGISLGGLLAFIAFNMTTIPCFATVATTKAELTKGKFNWTLVFWLVTSFIVSTMIYLAVEFTWTIAIMVVLIVLVVLAIKQSNKKINLKKAK